MVIYLPYPLPDRVKQHTRRFLRDGSPQCACSALLPVGFAWPPTSLPAPVVSYTAFSPSLRLREAIRSLLHSAVGFPRLAVSQHRTLWRADFPRLCSRDHRASPDTFYYTR